MGRQSRIQFPGACYYLTLLGNNRQYLFVGNQDRRYFLQLLRAYKDRFALRVYAYCLMGNEVHILIETSKANLSKVMQGFCTAYTKYFNRLHGTAGHVFQGRYKAALVDKDKLLLDATRHVHMTPARSGLGIKPWRYPWSSCSAFVSAAAQEPLADAEPVLAVLAKSRLTRSVRYLHILEDALKKEPELPGFGGAYIGDAAFAEAARRRGGDATPAPPRADPESVLREVSEKTGIDRERLLGRVQWHDVSRARKEAVYRLWREAGLGVSALGRMFQRTPSAISQIIRAMEGFGA